MLLSVPLAGDSIQDCVDSFFSSTPVPGWLCESCGMRHPASRSGLAVPSDAVPDWPRFLLVGLKRFTQDSGGAQRKSDRIVTAPLSLRIGVESQERPGYRGLENGRPVARWSDNSAAYRLVGVAAHHGLHLESGHWTALVHCERGWAHCDDSTIEEPLSKRTAARCKAGATVFLYEVEEAVALC